MSLGLGTQRQWVVSRDCRIKKSLIAANLQSQATDDRCKERNRSELSRTKPVPASQSVSIVLTVYENCTLYCAHKWTTDSSCGRIDGNMDNTNIRVGIGID